MYVSDNNNQQANNKKNNNIHMVVPYTGGLTESFKNICNKLGIQVHFKGGNTVKNLLVAPRDRDPIAQESE